jgi:hypothetical protein
VTYTLADAIRDEFERTHPGNRGALKCVQCRRRKDREDFRETPWHGRAAACKRCEGMRLTDEYALLDRWLLEQERAKVRMLIRHVQRLRLQRIIPRQSVNLYTLTADSRVHLAPESERRRKRARLTLQMERKIR